MKTMSHFTGHARRASRRGGRATVGLVLTTGFAGLIVLGALAYVAFVLWPRQLADVPPDTPSLPITVAGVAFNIPPAAIRVPVQRRAGAQERIDLVFLWPSLTPPDAKHQSAEKHAPPDELQPIDRLFMTIGGNDGTLSPAERMKAIYPRYLVGDPQVEAGGLVARRFGDATPYKDEDLIFDPAAADRFVARCNRPGATPGMCLFERRIGAADIIVRFPRDWLVQWQDLAEGVDRLIASLRPPGR
jgi:hypothetical protein